MTAAEGLPRRLEGGKIGFVFLLVMCWVPAAIFLTDPWSWLTQEALGHSEVLVFALRMIVGLIFLWLGAQYGLAAMYGQNRIDLDEDGFSVHVGRKQLRRKWTDCSLFSVIRERRGRASANVVVYHYFGPNDDKLSFSDGLVGLRRGREGSHVVPGNFGMKPEELSELLNTYRRQARRREGLYAGSAQEIFNNST
ncbi:MAG: hypothetical protein AAF414_11295 [Pseudomonadota bacterium]